MHIIKFNILIVLFFLSIQIYGQDKLIVADFDIINGDTIFLADIPEVGVLAFKNNLERKQYLILKRRVLKVYPYALLTKDKLIDIQLGLDSIPKRRHKRRYTKEVAKWVKEEYSQTLKNLTISEGKILIKLIYRETQKTSYQILTSYRGRFNAFFWQTMAKLWDNNLKSEYDPDNVREDMLIEHILSEARLQGSFK